MNPIDDMRDILRGALASLGGFGGRMFARFLLMMVAGQLYGAAPLGLLGQVAALVEILAAIAVLGQKRSLLDRLGKARQDNANEATVVKSSLLSAFLLSSIMAAILALVWPYLFSEQELSVFVVLAIPATAFSEVAGTAIRFSRVIRWEVIARMVMEPWSFFFAAVAFYYAGWTETGLLIAYGISLLTAAFGIWMGFRKVYGIRNIWNAPFTYRDLYRVPRYSLPYGITDLGVMSVRRLDILLLSIFAGNEATGIYYIAQQLVTVPHKIHQLFEPIAAPVFASLHHGKAGEATRNKIAALCRWVFVMQVAITVPLMVLGDVVLGVFGAEFTGGLMVLAILLVAELLDGSFALVETPLAFAAPKVPPMLVALALVIEVIAIGALASLWGAVGAAIGFLIAMASLAVMRIVMVRFKLELSLLSWRYLGPLTIGSLIGAVLYYLRPYLAEMAGGVSAVVMVSALAFGLWVSWKLVLPADDKKMLKAARGKGT